MTTTPTASPELPDLDHLEALARAATPGPWAYQEDSDAYTHIVRPVASPGWIIASATQTSKPEGEANGRWIAAANPAAVLALIALARRAQPASEATQTACTVPPEGWYCTRAPGYDGPCAAWPVAQQAAAPGAQLVIGVAAPQGATISIMQPHADGTTTVIYGGTHPVGDSMGRAVVAAAPSAPGTPEAPAAAEKLYASWQNSQPDRYNIPPWRLLAESVKIEWEQRAAAQLDGGKEGSAT